MPFSKSLQSLFREAYSKWSQDNAGDLAAALAYYAVFTIVPIIVLLIASLGIFFKGGAAQKIVELQITNALGPSFAPFITTGAFQANQSHNVLIASLSILVTLATAIALFHHLGSIIDHMWHAPITEAKPFWRNFLPNTALFLMLLAVSLLLFISAILSTALSFLTSHLALHLPWNYLIILLNIPILFLIGTLFFAIMYRYLPKVKLPFGQLLLGAATTSIFFMIGRLLIELYFKFKNPASVYGAASAVIVLLLWVYYSAQIFYFGVELTYVLAKNKSI